MSRDYVDDPPEDIAFTLRRIDDSLERIAKALDWYLDHQYGYGRSPLPEGYQLPEADPALMPR